MVNSAAVAGCLWQRCHGNLLVERCSVDNLSVTTDCSRWEASWWQFDGNKLSDYRKTTLGGSRTQVCWYVSVNQGCVG